MAMAALRMTLQTQLVLRALLERPGDDHYGLEISDQVGLPSGTIYPILARLEQVGWVVSQWEPATAEVDHRRPRRRYYRMTPDGAEQARHALATAYKAGRSSRRLWTPSTKPANGTIG